MSNAFSQFGFNQNDNNVGGPSKRFKGEGGRSYRVSFAWWPGLETGDLNLDADTPEFTGAERNYLANVGYFINRGPEFTKLAGAVPRMAIGTVILDWPLTKTGDLDTDAIKEGLVVAKPWIFSQDKYNSFKPIHKEFPFGSHDLAIQCSDTQYQKMTFTPCRESLLRKIKESAPERFASIVAKVQQVAGSIQNDIGRELTLDQIREKLSGGGGGGAAAAVPVSSASTKEIDSIVDNLLD